MRRSRRHVKKGYHCHYERTVTHGLLQANWPYSGSFSEQAHWSFLGTMPRTGGIPLHIGRTMDVVKHVACMYEHIVRRHPHRTDTVPQTMKILDITIAPSACKCQHSLGTTECTVPSGHDHHDCPFRSCRRNRFRISEHRTYRLQHTASVSPSVSDYRDAWKPPD